MVLVLCMTYNHEKYIEDALKGFVMQKTDFPFVVAVVDDASTDNNASVITDYLQRVCDADIINPKIEEYGKVIDATPADNPNCLLHVVLLNENHYGKKSKRPYYIQFEEKAKYIATCEGDDYWTYPYKLQKQVDILEQNENLSICVSRVQAVSKTKEETGWLLPYDGVLSQGEFSLEDFCRLEWGGMEWIFHYNSFVSKKEFYRDQLNVHAMKLFPYTDITLLLYCLLHGNGYYISETMSCYRVDSGGYNSTMAANPERNIQQEHKLADALRAFDGYTDKKYHKYIQQRIRLCEYREYTLGKKHHWRIIMPQYWRCLPGKTARQKTLSAIEIIAPNMRKRLKQMKNAILHS